MLQRIRIQNFKAFRDTGQIEIRPITVIMGVNSSGKSSIIQALLALRQTMDSRDVEVPLHVVGDYVDLGSYSDCVFQHRVNKKDATFLSFEYTIIPNQLDRIFFRRRSERVSKPINFDAIHVSTTFGYNKKARKIYVRSFDLRDASNTLILGVSSNATGHISDAKTEAFVFAPDSKALVKRFSKNLRRRKFFFEYRQIQRLRSIPFGTEGFGDERQLASFTSSSYDATEKTFAKVFYLGPLRKKTPRFHPVTGETPQDVGFEGENVFRVLFKDLKASKKQSKNLLDSIKSWLKKFKVAVDVKVVSQGSNLFRVDIVDSNNGALVNLSDVGFGVSQILPVIVEGLYAPADSMILVEQPEIHLHPALQSDLGDLMIEIAANKKTVVVETHSEHLLLRLQRRVAEGKLNPASVAIYFVKPGREGSTVQTIELNNLGQFVNWPQGFFAEDVQEGLEHLQAISRRLQSKVADS